MDATRDLLVQFAQGTGHRERELDSEACVRLLCKKLLATQAPIVPREEWSHVYHYVSDDLDRVNFRSEDGHTLHDWAMHKEVPLEVFQTLLKDVNLPQMVKEGAATYNDFVDRVKPPKGDETLLFFLQGARDKNLRQHLDQLYPDENKQTVKELYDRLHDYQVHEHENPLQVTRDIGFMLVNADLPVCRDIYLYDEPEKREEEKAKVEKEVPQARALQLKPATEKQEWSEEHERQLRRNPVMMQYRKDTGISAHFNSRKLLKQYLVLAVGKEFTDTIKADILGKKQTLNSLPEIKVTDSHDDWMRALSVLSSYEPEKINEVVRLPQSHYFYNVITSALPQEEVDQLDSRSYLRLWLTAHSGEGWEQRWSPDGKVGGSLQRAVSKYLARYPQPPRELVEFLVDGPQ